MELSKQAESLGEVFADYVIAEDWESLCQLFSPAAAVTPELCKATFAWDTLLAPLQAAYLAASGQETADDEDDEVDMPSPTDKEIWNEVCRDTEYGPRPVATIGLCAVPDAEGGGPFIEIRFLPDEDSGYDNCYSCYLTVDDCQPPKVSGAELTLSSD